MSKEKSVKILSPSGVEYNASDLFLVGNIMNIFDVSKVTVYNWLGPRKDDNTYPDGKFPNAFKNGKIYIPEIDIRNIVINNRKG